VAISAKEVGSDNSGNKTIEKDKIKVGRADSDMTYMTDIHKDKGSGGRITNLVSGRGTKS